MGRGDSVCGPKLSQRNRFGEGFRSLVIFDGAEQPSEAMIASLLEYVVTASCEVFGASSVSLMLLDENEELTIRVSTGISPAIVREARRKLGEGISGWVAQNAKPLLLNGPISDPRFTGINPTISGALSVPLVAGGKAFGVLNLNTKKGGTAFCQRDLQVASLIGLALATAIESTLMQKEIEEDRRQLFMLFELGRALNEASTVQETLDIAARMLKDFTAAEACLIYELRDGQWLLIAADGQDMLGEAGGRFVSRDGGWLERCLASGNAAVANRIELCDQEISRAVPGATNLLAVPLLSANRSIGVVVCGRANGDPFSANTVAQASALSTQITAAWETANDRSAREEQIALGERHRIAQELHDSLAQELLGLVLAIEGCQLAQNQDQDAVQAQLAKATRMARGCLSDVRQYMTLLRSNNEEPRSIATLLDKVVEDFRRQTGISVDSDIAGAETKLEPRVQQAFVRIAQEALANTRKHAQATSVKLAFSVKDGAGELYIADNGIGFEVEKVAERSVHEGKYGLLGMRERAIGAGGRFDINSSRLKGTQITVRIPIAYTVASFRQASGAGPVTA